MNTTDKLQRILRYHQYAEELRACIPEEYGQGALVGDIVTLTNRPVAIYGAGRMGTAVYLWLKEKDISPRFFIDRKVKGMRLSLPIHDLEYAQREFLQNDYIVLIAVNTSSYEQNLIKKELVARGASMVLLRSDLDVRLEEWSYDIISDGKRLMDAYGLMADEESREAYTEYFRVHMTRDFWRGKEHDFTGKYFCKELFDIGKIENYICLGGYTGDSVLRFVAKGGRADRIIVFEPQEKYLSIMGNMFALLDDVAKESIEIVEKEAGDENSNTVMRIDDLCIRGGDTLISADIEGGEMKALMGAKQMLRENPPILALSAYHKYDDFPTLMDYILEQNPNYKFYARKYRSCYSVPANEIVLYGVPEIRT